MKNGIRITFKTKGYDMGIRGNPEYMKAWAEAAIVMKQRGQDTIYWKASGHSSTHKI
jgi:hypothetical protein